MNKLYYGWFLIYTKPRQENKVAQSLEKKGITHFLPSAKSIRQWHDRKKTIIVPLFPSYIFVKINSTSDYIEILNLSGVCNFIKQDNKPVSIDETLISQIKLFISTGQNVIVSADRFRPGQQCLIQGGIFTGTPCEIVNINGQNKIIVRVAILNSNLLISVDSMTLATAS